LLALNVKEPFAVMIRNAPVYRGNDGLLVRD
jgi:hypothetical protein